MVSVLIADDEHLIRSLIRNTVAWDALGLEVVCEAADGEQALEMVRRHRPQIALLDINMPFLNGLELSMKIKELDVGTLIIILTGYKDFEYARQSVTCQVFDYLLKPIVRDELEGTLTRARDRLLQENRDRIYMVQMELDQHRSKKLLQDQFLWRLAFGRAGLPDAGIPEEIERRGILLESADISVIAMQIDQYDAFSKDNSPYLYAVLNILEECLQERGLRNIYGLLDTDNCALLVFNANLQNPAALKLLMQACAKGVKAVDAHFNFTISVGVGRTYQGYDNLRFSVQAALEALESRFYGNGNRIYLSDHTEGWESIGGFFSSFNFAELHTSLSSPRQTDSLRMLRDIFDELRARHVRQEHVKLVAMGLVSVLYSVASGYRLPIDQDNSRQDPIFRRINKSEIFEEVEQAVLELCRYVTESIGQARNISKIVLSAVEYIDANYSQSDISLNKIAAAVFVAPAYVSYLFKKEMNISTTEYITNCRMRKAAELMSANKELNLSMTADAVGYTDPYYFSKCFKKYYGITPSKFLSNTTMQEALTQKKP